MGFIAFIRKWTLPSAMVVGVIVYMLFAYLKPLVKIGYFIGPLITSILPALIFIMFYLTFCNMKIVELRPQKWHFFLQIIQVILSAILVGIIILIDNEKTKIILEGVFICTICPTATAAPVITGKLGGNMASLTMFTIITNIVAAVTIPIFFPLVEKEADISFSLAFLMIFNRLIVVLIVPFILAQLSRRYLKDFTNKINEKKNLAFYIWAINLSIVMGMTAHNIATANVNGWEMLLLIVLPLVVTLVLFSIGKFVGSHYRESITSGQALGQKNTILAIWLTVNFLNPTAAIAPCAYVIWQNIVNSWQIWYKEKYGRLKW